MSGGDIKQGSIRAGDIADSAIPSVTYSAGVLEDSGNPQIINPLGFTTAEKTATGNYELTPPGGGADCNLSAMPAIPSGNGGTATIALTEAESDKLTFTTFGPSGRHADLGPGFGYFAFSVIASCPE